MTKLYYIHQEDHRDMSPDIRSLDVIAETEYHWTYMVSRQIKGETVKKPWACAKKDTHFSVTPEEAIERFIAGKEETLDLARQHVEEIVSMLTHVHDNKDKLIDQAK